MSETAQKAKSLFQERKPYHPDARRTLPVLVRQARASETIEYGVLAAEVGVHGGRNMAYPLGCIGRTLIELGGRWGENIPPLQTLVVNKRDGLPGVGVAPFTPDPGAFVSATQREKRLIVREILQDVFQYTHWHRVLRALDLEPLPTPSLPPATPLRQQGIGEGPEHEALKALIASNPQIVGARSMTPQVEVALQSGDVVDVLFRSSRRILAVEVKAVRTVTKDLIRGVFQCIKYRAVLEAQASVTGERVDVESVLALGGPMPPDVRRIANTLGITVIDDVTEA